MPIIPQVYESWQTLKDFVEQELECREASLIPVTETGDDAYIEAARAALRAVDELGVHLSILGRQNATARDVLIRAFGESAATQIADVSVWGNIPVQGTIRLLSSTESALLQVTCSGDAILSLPTLNVNRRPLYVIRDNEAAHIWEVEQCQTRERLGDSSWHPSRPRPFAKLAIRQAGHSPSLVQTA